jgi:RNA polymerase sigma factor (sigma-70 family)
VTPEETYLEWLPRIEAIAARICRRYHCSADETEEFLSTARLKFLVDDYAAIRQFQGKSSVDTYCTVVLSRLFLDERTRRWGKWRPSAVARRLGPVAVHLEQLLTRDGYTFDEACEILRTNFHVPLSPAELADLAARLPPRVPRGPEGEGGLDDVASPDPGPDSQLLEKKRDEVRERVLATLAKVRSTLPPEDALILKMRFESGFQYADIARHLGLDQKSFYRRIEKLFGRLQKALEKEGIQAEDVKTVLRRDAGGDEKRKGRGKGGRGPSKKA